MSIVTRAYNSTIGHDIVENETLERIRLPFWFVENVVGWIVQWLVRTVVVRLTGVRFSVRPFFWLMGSLNHIAAHVAKNDEATGGDASAAFIDRSTRKQTVAARFLWTVKLKLTWSAGRMQQRERASEESMMGACSAVWVWAGCDFVSGASVAAKSSGVCKERAKEKRERESSSVSVVQL